MNTSEKEFEMIYLLIKLLTVYIFQEICPITRTWRLQDFFQGLTKDLTIFSLYQRLKISNIFLFYKKKSCRLLTRVEKVCQKLNVCKKMKLTM